MLPRWCRGAGYALGVTSFVAALAGGCGSGNQGYMSTGDDAGGDDGGDAMGMGFGDATAGGLTITPQNPVLPVTGPGTTLQFTALVGGTPDPGALWTIDVADIGTIDPTGLFTASGMLGGPTQVAARAGKLTGTTTLTVKLTLTDNPGNVDPGTQGKLNAGGNADPGMKWLYPYDRTVFPRGIDPPVLQVGGQPPDAMLLHVSFGGLDYKGFYGASNPGRVTISPQLWKTISLSATGSDDVQVSVTKITGGQVSGPVMEHWTIAQGSLRGTVYYNSYNSVLAGNTGAVMSVRPGQSASVVVAGCRVCHTVSADGSTLVAANEVPNATATDRVWDLKSGMNPPATLFDAPNREWAFGALYPDGSRFLRFGAVPDQGIPGAGWAPNVRGLGQFGDLPSALFNPKNGQPIAAPGLDGTGMHMMMPIFAPDGTMAAFNHYDTGQGHSVAVMNFDSKTNTFSGLRDVGTIPTAYLGWPAFTPDDKFVFFAAGTDVEYDTISDDTNAIPNPTSDMWIAHVPTATIASADLLNGVSGGMYYLPFGEAAEGHLNYEPTILPEAVGGYFWVVFTTRREYGNTLNDADPYNLNAQPGARKKLWVAAVDIENAEHPYTKAVDLTHPAFYLDGQELASGNMRGFWALDPCKAMGTDCTTGDECCSGFCRQSTAADGATSFTCVPPQGCANEGEKCTVASDCCGAQSGTLCIAGYCGTTHPN
jgi:hypothetical protein